MKIIIFGTRPEIIKLYPVIKEMPECYVVFTGQHDKLAKQMLKEFKIKVDENLEVMTDNQSLSSLTIKLHQKLSELMIKKKPELVIIQGDTTSAMVVALEAYYHKIPVAHIEAGLRTDDIYAPFPEEINRRIITQIAQFNFTPTQKATYTCEHAHTNAYTYQVGNTVVDSVKEISRDMRLVQQKQFLLTIHRRENFENIPLIFDQVGKFLKKHSDWVCIALIHPNPNVRQAIEKLILPSQVLKVNPLGYSDMIAEMQRSSFIVTDSGGIQEEAPTLQRFVFVVREKTERIEGLGDCAMLVSPKQLYKTLEVKFKSLPTFMSNPYGDGFAGRRIAEVLK